MIEAQRTYLPAAGHDWFLPLYDPLVKLLGGDAARRTLLEQAAIQPSHRVLEIGCGTGSLVVRIKQLHPGAGVLGLDPDAKALARARGKAERAGVAVHFAEGFADGLPYPDASFDRVFSSFMFHHLGFDEKAKTLREARRVLKPGGSFHMLDFAGRESARDGFLAHLLHSSDRLQDNTEGRVLTLMRQAGFADSKKAGDRALLIGRVAYYRATAPALRGEP